MKGSWDKQPPSPAGSDMGEQGHCHGSGRSFREGCYIPDITVFSDGGPWWASPPCAGMHPDFPLPSPCHTEPLGTWTFTPLMSIHLYGISAHHLQGEGGVLPMSGLSCRLQHRNTSGDNVFLLVNTLEACDGPGGCGCCLLAAFDCILTDAEDGSEGEHHSW